MNVYLGKERQRAAQHVTGTYATVTILRRGVEGFGHTLHGQLRFLPDLCDDLAQSPKKIQLWDSEVT